MAETKSNAKQFVDGIVGDNPVLIQLLGMCPILAVTSTIENSLVMGAAATFVVVMSNLITSLLRSLIKPHVRILVFTLTIATFVTIADRVLKAFVYDVSLQLGPFIPLIIVNCMIICRAEVCAIKSNPVRALCDAFGIGIGFTLALTILGFVRELLGFGTLLGHPVMWDSFEPWVVMVLPPGAFITLGVVIGVVNWVRSRGSEGGAS